MIGARYGSRMVPLVGSRIGSGADDEGGVDLTGVERDATSNIYVPATAGQANQVFAGAGFSATPLALYLLQESSGNCADTIGGRTLTAAGTWTYNQAVAGWTRTAIHCGAAIPATMINNTFANINANVYTVVTYMQVASAGGIRYCLYRMGNLFDDDALIGRQNASPWALNVGEGDATYTTGTVDVTGVVRPFVLRVGATQVDGFTNAEKVVGGTKACNGTEFRLGGDNVQTNHCGTADYLWSLVIANELTDGQIRSLLQTLGWTVAW